MTCLTKVKIMMVMTLMFVMVGVGVGGNGYGDDDSGIERFHSRGPRLVKGKNKCSDTNYTFLRD